MACISTSTIARLPGLGANAQLDVAGHWFAEAPFEARDFNLGNPAHLFGVTLLLVNRRHFDGWPDDVRAAVREAAAIATASQRRDAAGEDALCLDRLTATGIEIAAASELDRRSKRRCATVREMKVGPSRPATCKAVTPKSLADTRPHRDSPSMVGSPSSGGASWARAYSRIVCE